MNLTAEIKNLKKSNQSLLSFFLNSSNNSSVSKSLFLSDQIETVSNGHLSNLTENTQLPLAFVILVLLGEKRNHLLHKADIKQLKLVGSLYDKAQYVFVQFGDYLSNNTDVSTYSQLIPDIPFDKYPLYYNCAPDVVFFIIRYESIYTLGLASSQFMN
jgi:hypothetical protein